MGDQHLVVGALSCIACGKGDRGCELQRLPQNRNMDRLESKSTMKYHKVRKSGHHFSCDRFSPSPHEDDPFSFNLIYIIQENGKCKSLLACFESTN